MVTILTRNTDILRAEVTAHIAADALVRESYWTPNENAVGGTGCFIGCLSHSDDPGPAFERFGLPLAVLRLAENIFEALPKEEGKAFFAALPDAVARDGKDLNRVAWGFLSSELRLLPKTTDVVQAVIDTVILGMDLLSNGQEWTDDVNAIYSVNCANAAYTKADGSYASYAASHATAAVLACRGTHPDVDVPYAADCVANAARTIAAGASYTATRLRQRDTLLSLIAAA